MKKKTALHHRKHTALKSSSVGRVQSKSDTSVILVRSWVFLVMFAIMMGLGVIIGNYLNYSMSGSPPMVAGISTQP